MYCIKHTRTQPHIYTWLMLLLLLLSGVKGWGQVITHLNNRIQNL